MLQNWFGSEQVLMAGLCGHVNNPFGSIQGWEFLA
jgi:hypothetical protein